METLELPLELFICISDILSDDLRVYAFCQSNPDMLWNGTLSKELIIDAPVWGTLKEVLTCSQLKTALIYWDGLTLTSLKDWLSGSNQSTWNESDGSEWPSFSPPKPAIPTNPHFEPDNPSWTLRRVQLSQQTHVHTITIGGNLLIRW